MFKLLTLAVTLAILVSCSRYYTYDIKLEKPVESETLTYENDTMSITFDFDQKWIDFELYNKSEDGIKILWDELSMSENGTALRIVHKNTGTTRITDLQPPTSVPPKSKMVDQLIPSKNVRYTRAYGQLSPVLLLLYPTTDYGNKKERAKILAKKGQKIVIYFPYYIRNQYQSKTFEFMIDDVRTQRKGAKK